MRAVCALPAATAAAAALSASAKAPVPKKLIACDGKRVITVLMIEWLIR